MAVSAYKIAVSILAVNGVSSVLKIISRDVLGLGKNIDSISKKFGKWRIGAIGVGTAVAGIGIAALGAEYRLAKVGDELIRQERLLRASGAGKSETQAATARAESIAQHTFGVTPAEALRVIREMRTAIGTTPAAMQAAPEVMRMVAALNAFNMPGFTNKTVELIKALDLMGAGLKHGRFSPTEFAKSFRALTQMEILAGGLIPPNIMMRFAQLGGFVGQITGNPIKFLQQSFAMLMQLGTRAGSGMAQLINQLVGGQATTKSVFGMLSMYHILKPGGFKDIYGHFWIKPGGLIGYKELTKEGPLAWLTKVLLPKLRSEGVTSPAQMVQAISMIIGSVRAARDVYAMLLLASHKLYERDIALTQRALGTHPYQQAFKTLHGSTAAFSAALAGLFQVLGAAIVPTAVKYINDITRAILHLENLAASHPATTTKILKIFMGLSAAMVAIGTTAVVGALITLVGPTGLIVGLASAIIVLANAFGKMKPMINFIGDVWGLGTKKKHGGFWNYLLSTPLSDVFLGPKAWRNNVQFMPRKPTPADFGIHLADFGMGLARVPTASAHNDPFHGNVVNVHVTNGRDLADGVTKHQAQGLQTNPSTPVGHNLRRGFLPPGLPMMPSPVS